MTTKQRIARAAGDAIALTIFVVGATCIACFALAGAILSIPLRMMDAAIEALTGEK